METHPTAVATCSECHSTLGANGRCLMCLLRAGLPEENQVRPSLPPPPAAEREEAAFGDYEIDRREDGSLWELGRGGMGVTYRAVDRVLQRAVALKVVQLGAVASAAAGSPTALDCAPGEVLRQRFLREARAAAALRHPNVATVFQFGAAAGSGQCFYAMELIEGETLTERVGRQGPLDADITLAIAVQVAAALVAAADRGLVHRDLKPSNLMLEGIGPSLHVKVIDFGLAKAASAAVTTAGESDLTQGGFVGTPAFASPEQLDGGTDLDARTDIYSLGVTLWYALTGRTPFGGPSLEALRGHPARRALPLERLEARHVPGPLISLLRAMLAEDPADRPASARELLGALEACREPRTLTHVGERPPSPGGRTNQAAPRARVVAAVTAVLLILAAGAVAWWRLTPRSTADGRAAAAMPGPSDKSVAVLPFDNFSEDRDSAFFADGVQDEILTDLAKVADLKVISRSSVLQYKEAKQRNLPEIGKSLGVAYVVEGSVQRVGNRIRVTAQLIDTRTDAHRWAERYDRELSDLFAIQSEVAQKIAAQLQGTISPRERAAMMDAPTHDLAAYAAYLHAREFWNSFDVQDEALFQRTLDILREATTRDPAFARAFAFATYVQALGYRVFTSTPAQAALVRDSAATVARLRPGSGEAHLAAGFYDFFVAHAYEQARDEAAAAVRQSPNDAAALDLLGFTEDHLGHWDEGLAHLRKGTDLDPEDVDLANDYVQLLVGMRRYPEAVAALDRRIGTHQQAFWAHACKAEALLAWRGDVPAARTELAAVPPEHDPQGLVTALRLACDRCERDFAAAERDLAASPLEEIYGVPRAFFQGWIARCRGDAAAAVPAFTAAREALQAKVRLRPEQGRLFLYLATADAALGRREEALAEMQTGLSRRIPEHNIEGPRADLLAARVLAWAGERDGAIRALEEFRVKPYGPGYGPLSLDPDWDPLRGDPRFEALVADLAPKR